MRFIVIRHAESQWNREGIIQGQLDSPVTPQGHRQIAALMVALKEMPFSQIFSSPSGRAMTTAQALASQGQCALSSDVRLHEQHFGCLQGQPYHQAMRSHPDIIPRIFAGEPAASAPEGESAFDVAQRLSAFFLSFPSSLRGTFGVVTHGHALQALIWQLKGETGWMTPADTITPTAVIQCLSWVMGGCNYKAGGCHAFTGAAAGPYLVRARR
ncbi:histidine phosphatase family protein [Serratia sp. L9]|uniref:histidine phosphatase family protein n=1 Tax=Serratia sp. L9 TaxID=3423946 RepID=UPI003D67CF55